MPYVRVSMMQARPGEEARVRDLLDRLIAYYAQQPGYLAGYRLEPTEPGGYVGRIGVWQREEDAEHAAQTEHDMAIRSQLNMAVVDHTEYSFRGFATSPA